MQVRISSRARSHIQAIGEYLGETVNREEKERERVAIRAALFLLSRFPRMGHVSQASGTLEWLVRDTSYILVYEIRGKNLILLGVFHESQNR